jgi:hypothetical protein
MMHLVKQESNSQVDYPACEPPSYNYTHREEYTSEEDPDEEPEKQVEVPRRTGKRGRPPSSTSKAAAKRKGTKSNYRIKVFKTQNSLHETFK